MLKEINETNFTNECEIYINDLKPVVISFSASWCGPCKLFHPILEKISDEFPNILIVNNNIDDGIGLANKFKVKAIPTLLLFKNGTLIEKVNGKIDEKHLRSKMNNLLEI